MFLRLPYRVDLHCPLLLSPPVLIFVAATATGLQVQVLPQATGKTKPFVGKQSISLSSALCLP